MAHQLRPRAQGDRVAQPAVAHMGADGADDDRVGRVRAHVYLLRHPCQRTVAVHHAAGEKLVGEGQPAEHPHRGRHPVGHPAK